MEAPVDVSIVLPVYNAAEFLPEALDSIFCQTYYEKGSCELIGINDGSTDSSLSILEDYRKTSIMYVQDVYSYRPPNAIKI
jgi:glycosyltransferase involved in cell wall biosynthesis